MNAVYSVAVCALLVFPGNSFVLAQTKSSDVATSAKLASPTEPTPTEKKPTGSSANEKKADTASELCQCINRDGTAAAKKIEQALIGPLHHTGLDYTDQPLKDVVTQLSDEYGIPIQLDKSALDEAGISTDSQVSVSLHNISFRSALKLMLRTVQLTWIIQDEVLMITTNEVAEKQFDTCVYNVQGLVDDSDPKSVKALIDAIYGCVESDTWAESGGGQAEIRPLPSGLIVVSQTPAVHEEVSALLDKIRKLREKVPLVKAGPHGYESPAINSLQKPSRQTSEKKGPTQTGGGGGGASEPDEVRLHREKVG